MAGDATDASEGIGEFRRPELTIQHASSSAGVWAVVSVYETTKAF